LPFQIQRVRRYAWATIFRTLRPVWGERFAFVASKELEMDEVECNLFDEDRFGAHDFLGGVSIPVSMVEEGTHAPAHWVRLNPQKPAKQPFRGTLSLACYLDADVPGRLHVSVVSAAKIEAADFGGSSDPYVRVNLLRLGEDEVGRCTRSMRFTLEPAKWYAGFKISLDIQRVLLQRGAERRGRAQDQGRGDV
jgi:Ca2+-dependent lipid-binding protein